MGSIARQIFLPGDEILHLFSVRERKAYIPTIDVYYDWQRSKSHFFPSYFPKTFASLLLPMFLKGFSVGSVAMKAGFPK